MSAAHCASDAAATPSCSSSACMRTRAHHWTVVGPLQSRGSAALLVRSDREGPLVMLVIALAVVRILKVHNKKFCTDSGYKIGNFRKFNFTINDGRMI